MLLRVNYENTCGEHVKHMFHNMAFIIYSCVLCSVWRYKDRGAELGRGLYSASETLQTRPIAVFGGLEHGESEFGVIF